MKKLKLKEEYKGVIVTRNHMKVGKVTFNANSVKEEQYINFYNLGFEELFIEVEEAPKAELLVEDKLIKPIVTPSTKPKRKPNK